MAIVNMKKVSLIALQKDKKVIIDALMQAGVIHINDLSEKLEELDTKDLGIDNEDITNIVNDLENLKHSIDYLSKYANCGTGKAGSYTYDELATLENKESILNVTEKVFEIDRKFSELNSREIAILNRTDELKPWAELDIAIADMDGTKTTAFMIGTVPISVAFSVLTQKMMEEMPESYIEEISQGDGQRYLFVAFHTDISDRIANFLKGFGFSKAVIKDVDSTVSQELEKLKTELESISKERENLEAKLKNLCTLHIKELKALYDFLAIERDKKRVISKLIKTDSTFMLEGWIPFSAEKSLEGALETVKNDCWIEVRDAKKGERHPIKLKNHPLVEPFEIITELFSLPNSDEVDPNPAMAPFFFLLFGIMLGDAGYGILMSIGSWFALRKIKPKGILEKILKLVFLCGISTAFWGALFGSWFGNVFDIVGLPIKAIWFNPMDNPMKMLIFSFGLGVVHLFAGIGVKAYRNIIEGKLFDAIFDQGFWYVFILGIIFLLVPGMGTLGKYMGIIGAIALILTQGRHEKNIIKKFFTGVLSLTDISGFMSDVFSYSRLLALGLSTGVVATVVNTMGAMPGFNFVGVIVFIFAFVVGHVFNIAINVLGSYVHTSRLQYVEFFSKFYEGGGKAYSPFKAKTKYININNEEE